MKKYCSFCGTYHDPNWVCPTNEVHTVTIRPQEKLHPVGIMPERLWIEKRISDLWAAINRYADAGLPVPAEWIKEHNKHCKTLNIERGTK
jgi:hypothetical protein